VNLADLHEKTKVTLAREDIREIRKRERSVELQTPISEATLFSVLLLSACLHVPCSFGVAGV